MMRQMNPESLKGMASLLQQYGRNGDTMLAHINPREAMLLDRVSGGGSMNPMTGMPEFFNGDDDTDGGDAGGAVGGEDNPGGESGGESGGGFAGDAEDDAGYDEFDVSTIDFGLFGPAAGPEGLANLGADGPADTTGLALDETRTAAEFAARRGLGSLAGQMMPDSPGIMEILTAPIESLVDFFTMGAVDLELTGKDVFGVPGMTSTDLSRGMAGLQGPQPVGVEIGFSPIGTVGIDKSGVGAYGGPITNFLNEAFSSNFAKNPDNQAVTQAAAEKVQAAKEIATQQREAALPTSDRGPITGYAQRQDMPLSLTPSFKDVTTTSKMLPDKSALNAPKNPALGYAENALTPMPSNTAIMPSNTAIMPSNTAIMEQMTMQPPIPAYLENIPRGFTESDAIAVQNFKNTAKGVGNTLSDLFSSIQQRVQGRAGGGYVRGPITGGQRSGSGIMSLR